MYIYIMLSSDAERELMQIAQRAHRTVGQLMIIAIEQEGDMSRLTATSSMPDISDELRAWYKRHQGKILAVKMED